MSRNYGGTMVANLFVKFGADTTDYQKKMRAAVTRMLFAAESLTQAGRILSTAVTAPMIMIGVASLKTAMQFESAMTRMVSLVGMPAETIARWKPVVQDMAGIVGKSANELAEALFFITSNGIRTDDALRVLTATAKASAVGMGETKDIAIAATSALNAYGTGALTANESVAILIGTVREGNLEAAELPAALSKLLPVAAAMGIEFHEAGAGIAAMSRSGTSARLAAFGLRAIMMGILAPTKSAADALESVELSSAKLKQVLSGPTGLRDALLMMKDATEQGDVTLKDLLPNQRAFAAALQLLGKNTQDYIDISENMAEVVGEDVDKAFKVGAGTMERTYKQAMGALSSAAIDLGENMAPLIDNFADLAKTASKTARAYNELGDTQKGLIDGLAIMTVMAGPLLYALGSLARMMARFTGLSILFGAGVVKNAAGFGVAAKSTSIWTTALGGLGASFVSIAALAATVGIAAFTFMRAIDDQFGITEALTEEFGRLGDAASTIAEAFEDNSQHMQDATDKSTALARKIGEVALANELMDARMAGNAKQMAILVIEIDKKAAAYNKAMIKADGMTESEEKAKDTADALKDATAELAAEQAEYTEGLRKARDLMTSGEVTAAMDQLVNDYKDIKESGVDVGLQNSQFKDDWNDIVDLAETYGIATSKAFKKIGESMLTTGDIENSEYYKLWAYYIPQKIEEIPGKAKESWMEISDGAYDGLTGGFDKGITDAIGNYSTIHRPSLEKAFEATVQGGFGGVGDELRDKILNMLDLMSPLELDVVPNKELFNQTMQDLLDGNMPDTRG